MTDTIQYPPFIAIGPLSLGNYHGRGSPVDSLYCNKILLFAKKNKKNGVEPTVLN